jgi:hypothetical protein
VSGRDNSYAFRKFGICIALGCVIVLVVAATDGGFASDPDTEANRNPQRAGDIPAVTADGGSPSTSSEARRDAKLAGGGPGNQSTVATDEPAGSAQPDHWSPVFNDEALPCTGPHEPVNFETFSAGPSIAGLPLTHGERRCGGGPVAARVNYVSYLYGNCKILEGESGCQPPLEIQTWPACQRYLAKYSFQGKPLPHTDLPLPGGAKVVEFNAAFDKRIEVYTSSATVVIFAIDRARAVEAAKTLRMEDTTEPPASKPQELDSGPPDRLEPPAQGSMEGSLPCQV